MARDFPLVGGVRNPHAGLAAQRCTAAMDRRAVRDQLGCNCGAGGRTPGIDQDRRTWGTVRTRSHGANPEARDAADGCSCFRVFDRLPPAPCDFQGRVFRTWPVCRRGRHGAHLRGQPDYAVPGLGTDVVVSVRHGGVRSRLRHSCRVGHQILRLGFDGIRNSVVRHVHCLRRHGEFGTR